LFGPDGYGDGHLLGDFVPRTNRKIRRDGWGGIIFETFKDGLRRLKPESYPKGDRLLPAYSVYVRSGADSPTDPNIIRGARGFSKTSIYTLEL